MSLSQTFFGINHSIHLLFGWPEVSGVSKSTSSACPGSCHFRTTDVSCFDVNSKTLLQEDSPLRLSSGFWGVVKW